MIEIISGNTPAQITDLNLEDIILRKQILSYLEKNSKMDPREIAILLGTEPDVVENEIRKMEEEKIIDGNTVKVINHFSHNGKALHADLERHFGPYGIEVGYDGMVLPYEK